MAILLTAFQLLLTGVAVYAAYRAIRSEHGAEGHAKDLLTSKGRLIANEESIAALNTRHIALNGRVNATIHRLRQEPADDDDAPQGRSERQADAFQTNGLDPDLAAELALQRAPSRGPGD